MCTSNASKKPHTGQNPNDKPCKILKGIALNMIKHIFLWFRSFWGLIIDAIFSLIWDGTRQKIPDLDHRHQILSESAVSLAAKIRNKELKSADLVGACIERIKAVNPLLNAVTDERFEDALKEARGVDKLIESGLPDQYFKERPFLGVPFTAKESHAVRGLLHTLGVVSRKHIRAPYDAECVELLKAAGAICVAVTNIPEICKWQETRNMVFGQTNNPYHTGRTTGGSSGGEAALAAALATPIALCSDIGGSTRMPAFYCGLFGLNPTAGYTSLKGSGLRSGMDPSMASIGYVCKHAEDMLPLTKIQLRKPEEFHLDREIDIKDVKFYYTETAQDLRVSPICSELRKAMTNVIKKLTEDAKTTEQAPKPYYHHGFDHIFNLWKHGMGKETENFAALLTNCQGEAKATTEIVKKLLGMSQYTLAAVMMLVNQQMLPKVNKEWAETLTNELKEDLIKTLGANGVLIFPSAPAPAPYHYSLLLRPFDFAYWGVFNALHCPAVQIPLGLNADDVPLGIQIVGAPKQEKLLVTVATHFEKLFGGYVPPCNVMK